MQRDTQVWIEEADAAIPQCLHQNEAFLETVGGIETEGLNKSTSDKLLELCLLHII